MAMFMWISIISLLAGFQTLNACSSGGGGGGGGGDGEEGGGGDAGYQPTNPPELTIYPTTLYILSNPCGSITVPGGETIQLVPGPMPNMPNPTPGISRSRVCQLPAMANSSSSAITGVSTTEAPTSTTISSTSVWTTMATFIGYSTPSLYETTTTPSIFGEGPLMFVLDNLNRAIFYGDALNLHFSTLFTFPEHVDPMGITIGTSGYRVLWTDLKTNLIHGATLDGAHPKIYSLGLYKEPVSISLVESSGTVYCAYSKSNKITRLHLGYPNCEPELITNTPNPRAIAIDESGRFLYWSRDGGIDRINLSSSWRQTIYQNPELTNITGLAVVSSGPATRVAFFDIDKHRAFYIDLNDPDNVVELTSYFPADDFLLVTQMSVYGEDIFWTKTGDSAGSSPGVYSMSNYTSSRDLQFTEVPSFNYPVGVVISQF